MSIEAIGAGFRADRDSHAQGRPRAATATIFEQLVKRRVFGGRLGRFLGPAEPAVPFPHLSEGGDLPTRMARSLLLGEDDVFSGR